MDQDEGSLSTCPGGLLRSSLLWCISSRSSLDQARHQGSLWCGGDTNSITSHIHLPSISSFLNSHPSPSSLTYHPPSAFSLRFDFKLAERFARVVLRCLSPTSLGFSRSSLLLTRSLLSLLLSCLLFPLGSHSGTSIVSQHYHLHSCRCSIGTSSLLPEGSPHQEYQVLSLERSPRTACLSV